MPTYLILAVVFAMIFITTGYCSNTAGEESRNVTSLRIGFWGPTHLSIDKQKFDLESSLSLGLNIDSPRKNGYYTGLAIDL